MSSSGKGSAAAASTEPPKEASFADTLFSPEKWEWLNKLKEQVSIDKSDKEEQPASTGALTENLFSPEKWDWVVKLNQQMRAMEQQTGPERLLETNITDIFPWMEQDRSAAESKLNELKESKPEEHLTSKSLVPEEEYDLLEEEPYSLEEQSFMDPSSVGTAEVENICSSLLPAVLESSAEFESCTKYIKELYNITDEVFRSLHERAEKKLVKDRTLECKVKDGSVVQIKGFKSFTEFTCHLTILSSDKVASSQSTFVMDWVGSGIVTSMEKAEFVPASVHPAWDQSFKMKLNSLGKDMIVVEVWAKRGKSSFGIKKSKEYYMNQDNMVGRAFYTLSSSLKFKDEVTLQLLSRSGKEERGTLKLQLGTLTPKDEDKSLQVCLEEHRLLLKSIVNQEANENGRFIRSWEGQLSSAAEMVLSEHVQLCGISTFQARCIRFHVLMEYHQKFQVKMIVLYVTLEQLFSAELPSDGHTGEVKQLLSDMNTLYSMLLKKLDKLLLLFDLTADNDLNEISFMVRIMKTLFSFSPFLKMVGKKDAKEVIEETIKVSVPKWFLKLSEVANEQSDGELASLVGICFHCSKYCQRVIKQLNPMFTCVGVDYYSMFYVELDKVVYGVLVPQVIEVLQTKQDQEHYELYVVFKNLFKLSVNVHELKRKELKILDFHSLFRDKTMNWIDLAAQKCKEKIELTVVLDERVKVDLDLPQFSSSAVDTGEFLLQLGNFWKNLDWPVPVDSVGQLCAIIEKISEISMHYVDALYRSLHEDSSVMYDEQGRFQSSERLCVVLNNMYHVKKTLSDMPTSLELSKCYAWMDKSDENQLGKKTETLINTLLMSRDEDIDNKIYYFTDKIAEKLTPDISHFFEIIIPTSQSKESTIGIDTTFQWPWEKVEEKDKSTKLSNEDAISPLLDFLTGNLQVLGRTLVPPILKWILAKLWSVVLGIVEDRASSVARKPSFRYLYERLQYFMVELKNFFHAGGNGMSMDELETDSYKRITKKLDILLTSSKDLISKFLLELVEEQQRYNSGEDGGGLQSQGTLQISVGYLLDKQALEVSVIQAKLPTKGKLSTAAEVCLLPGFAFKSGKTRQRTPVVKGTGNPFYGKEFLFSVKEEEISLSGSSLVFHLINTDSSATLGTSIVSTCKIPRLQAAQSISSGQSMPERVNISLALFTPDKLASMEEIQARQEANDADIINFQKLNPRLFPGSSSAAPDFDIVNVFDSLGSKLTNLFS